jgi:5-formyltetrahydrofolate cyclo-ligase
LSEQRKSELREQLQAIREKTREKRLEEKRSEQADIIAAALQRLKDEEARTAKDVVVTSDIQMDPEQLSVQQASGEQAKELLETSTVPVEDTPRKYEPQVVKQAVQPPVQDAVAKPARKRVFDTRQQRYVNV